MDISSIVIVGAGQAGASAVAQLRLKGYTGRIVLIGDESHPPYERPPPIQGRAVAARAHPLHHPPQ